jgi:hypothetical protein
VDRASHPRAEWQSELAAARAEHARLLANASEKTADLDGLDAESETLVRLTALRAAISGQAYGAPDLPALRAALARVFEFVAVMPEAFMGTGRIADDPDLTRLALVPAARPEMVLLADAPPFTDLEVERVPLAWRPCPWPKTSRLAAASPSSPRRSSR